MNFLCNVWGLTVEEWLLGQSVDEQEFRQRYLQAQGSRSADLPTAYTGGAGRDAVSVSTPVSGVGKATGADALREKASCQS